MKYYAILVATVLFACGFDADRPDNLIEEDIMVEILYDLALLDAMKAHNPMSLELHSIEADKYIYKKYSIDSLQFANSNQYYAADIETYKEMYSKVTARIASKKAEVDEIFKKTAKPEDLLEVVPLETERPSGGFLK